MWIYVQIDTSKCTCTRVCYWVVSENIHADATSDILEFWRWGVWEGVVSGTDWNISWATGYLSDWYSGDMVGYWSICKFRPLSPGTHQPSSRLNPLVKFWSQMRMNSHAIFIFVLGVNFATATCSFLFIINQQWKNLRWPNTVFTCALADAIQHMYKDCKNKHAIDTAITLLAQCLLYLCNWMQCVDCLVFYNKGMLENLTMQRTQ